MTLHSTFVEWIEEAKDNTLFNRHLYGKEFYRRLAIITDKLGGDLNEMSFEDVEWLSSLTNINIPLDDGLYDTLKSIHSDNKLLVERFCVLGEDIEFIMDYGEMKSFNSLRRLLNNDHVFKGSINQVAALASEELDFLQ